MARCVAEALRQISLPEDEIFLSPAASEHVSVVDRRREQQAFEFADWRAVTEREADEKAARARVAMQHFRRKVRN